MARILMIHCRYRQLGGEEVSVSTEVEVLRRAGHDVRLLERNNHEVGPLVAAGRQIISRWAYQLVRDAIDEFKPHVVHFHNVCWVLGPSAVLAAYDAGKPILAGIHNLRLLFGWHDVLHAPYQQSRLGSLPIALGNQLHRHETWGRCVDVFLPVSQYIGRALAAHGLGEHAAIKPKPNGLAENPPVGDGSGGYGLFVGRLTPEKGFEVLQGAWAIAGMQAPLLVLGAGPQEVELRTLDALPGPIQYLGQRSHAETLEIMGRARCVIVPSVWDEPFGRVAAEAMAVGTPTIVSDAGGLPETHPTMVVPRGDKDALAGAISAMWGLSLELYVVHRQEARARYLAHFSPELGLKTLMGAYLLAMHRCSERTGQALDFWAMMDWRSIETAPKDGPSTHRAMLENDDLGRQHMLLADSRCDAVLPVRKGSSDPSGWMPLPDLPTTEE